MPKICRRHGFTLVEILVSLGISGVVVLIVQGLLADVFRSAESIEIDAQIAEIRASVLSRVHCAQTFSANGIDGRTGSGPGLGTQIQLVDKAGKNILRTHSLGGIFAPYKQIDSNWFADVSWTGKAIAVKIAKKAKSASTWAKDPYTGRFLDFSSTKQIIFSDSPNSVRLCPVSDNSRLLVNMMYLTVSELASYTSGLNRQSPAWAFLSGPIYLNKGCHYYCESQGYVSGYGLGAADSTWIYDTDGKYVLYTYPPGQGPAGCRCFL